MESKIPPSVKVEQVQNYSVRPDAYKSMWPETYPFQELTDVWLQSSSPSYSKNRGCQAKPPETPTLKKREKGRLRELQASEPVAVPGKIKQQILLKEYQGTPEMRM